MRNLKKTDYYFKVATDTRNYYCCFSAYTYDQAKRNLLFVCFSYKHDDDEPFKIKVPDTEERYKILLNLYSHRINDTTKEIFEEKDQFQND